MKNLSRILVPTDLSEHSRRALAYGAWLSGEEKAELIILHVVRDLNPWDIACDDFALYPIQQKPWPLDRALQEAGLDLSHFLEAGMDDLKRAASATKRVVFGPIAERIAVAAEDEKADIIIMSPRRRRGLRHLLFGSITDRVTRISPCPVLSVASVHPSAPWRGDLVPLWLPWRRRPATI